MDAVRPEASAASAAALAPAPDERAGYSGYVMKFCNKSRPGKKWQRRWLEVLEDLAVLSISHTVSPPRRPQALRSSPVRAIWPIAVPDRGD